MDVCSRGLRRQRSVAVGGDAVNFSFLGDGAHFSGFFSVLFILREDKERPGRERPFSAAITCLKYRI